MYYSKNQIFFELQYIMPEVFKIFLKKTPEKYYPKIPKKYNTIPNNIIFKKYNPDQKNYTTITNFIYFSQLICYNFFIKS